MTKTGVDSANTQPLQLPKQPDLQLQSEQREIVEHLYNQMQIFKSILTVDPTWMGFVITQCFLMMTSLSPNK